MTVASAPASSANLGPGFDVLAVALGLRCSVDVHPDAAWAVRSEGNADDSTTTMVRSIADAIVPGAGPFSVRIGGDIPVACGLGSSAALLVATAAAMQSAICVDVDRDAIFRAASEVEGHPDNVAAATLGGAVMVGPSGAIRSLDVHPSLVVLVAVPNGTVSTRSARAVLEDPVDRALASRTAARLGFLIEGLRTADPALLAEAAGDELHERAREAVSPLTNELVASARAAGAVHAAWSGSGPAALALVTDATEVAVRLTWEAVLGGADRIIAPGIDQRGLVLG